MEAGPRNGAQQPDSGADTAPLTDDGPDTGDGLSGPDGAGSGPLTDPDALDDSDAPDDGPGEGGESFRELRPRAVCGCGSWPRSSRSPPSAR